MLVVGKQDEVLTVDQLLLFGDIQEELGQVKF